MIQFFQLQPWKEGQNKFKAEKKDVFETGSIQYCSQVKKTVTVGSTIEK